jgi:hypothetical protein
VRLVAKPVQFSAHAVRMMAMREISSVWVESILEGPEIVKPDRSDPLRVCAFGRINAFGGRWLRVVYVELEDALRVITVFFDRGMEKLE